MYQPDVYDYEGLSAAEAEDKANREFDKYLERKTDKRYLKSSAGKVLLASIVWISMILVLVMNTVITIKYHSLSSIGNLGLDATNGVYVADKAGVLNDKVRQQAYDLNKELEKSDYHAQIMVVVVDKVPSKYGSINDYSMAIAEKYKPGDKKQNTGLLYTVAIKDHKARLEVGYGLEAKIPDATAAKLQQPANAHYKNGEYSAGVSALLDGVRQILLDGKPVDKITMTMSHETDKTTNTSPIWLLIVTDNTTNTFLWLLIGLLDCVLFIIVIASVIGSPILLFVMIILYIELVQDIKEYCSRIKDPSSWVTRDREDREHAIRTAIDMALRPESYRHSSSFSSNWRSSSDGGSFFSSSSSSGSSGRSSSSSFSGGGSFGGGGATTSW